MRCFFLSLETLHLQFSHVSCEWRTPLKWVNTGNAYWKTMENVNFHTAGFRGVELKKYISKQRAGVCFKMGCLVNITLAVRMRSDTGYWRASCWGTLFLLGGRNRALNHCLLGNSRILWLREAYGFSLFPLKCMAQISSKRHCDSKYFPLLLYSKMYNVVRHAIL